MMDDGIEMTYDKRPAQNSLKIGKHSLSGRKGTTTLNHE